LFASAQYQLISTVTAIAVQQPAAAERFFEQPWGIPGFRYIVAAALTEEAEIFFTTTKSTFNFGNHWV
jgi:hypothetical protein